MKKLITMAAVAIIFAACSKNEAPDLPVEENILDTPISLNVDVIEAISRAGYPAGTLTTGAMGFYMQTAGTENLDATTASKYNGTNRQVEYAGGQWKVVGSPLLWHNKTDEVSWQAYYPYTDTDIIDGILTVNIPTNQAVNGVYDLLYASGKTSGAASANGINIELKHQLSKLIVNLIIGTELGDIEVESVVLTGMQTKSQFNPMTGFFVGVLENPANINMIKHKDGKTFEAIILPYAPGSIGLDIVLKGGRKFYYKQGSTIFDEGMIHTLDILVGKDKVETAAMTTADWVDVGNESILETN